jgi:hypothetical protein
LDTGIDTAWKRKNRAGISLIVLVRSKANHFIAPVKVGRLVKIAFIKVPDFCSAAARHLCAMAANAGLTAQGVAKTAHG